MKHIFLDTNIIVDIFAARAPHDIAAIELYRLAKDNKIKIYISAESFTTIYYILRINKIAHNKCLIIFQDLLKTTTVITTNELIIIKALHIGFDDFGDIIIGRGELVVIRGGWNDRYGNYYEVGIVPGKPSALNISIKGIVPVNYLSELSAETKAQLIASNK